MVGLNRRKAESIKHYLQAARNKSFYFFSSLRLLKLAAVLNNQLLAGLARSGANSLNLFKNAVTLDELAEDDVRTVEPVGRPKGNEELAAVGAGASVRHAEEAALVVLNVEVLVGELGTVDRNAARAIVVGEVAALGHEVLDDAVESASLVGVLLLVVACAQRSEVFSSLGHIVCEQLAKLRYYKSEVADLLQTEVHRGSDR